MREGIATIRYAINALINLPIPYPIVLQPHRLLSLTRLERAIDTHSILIYTSILLNTMPGILTLAGGYSIKDYPRRELLTLCHYGFVIAVNDSAFEWPCDIVVAMDNSWIRENTKRLLKLNKPMVIRWWDEFKGSELEKANLIPSEPEIRLENDIVEQFPLSGMLACKIADRVVTVSGQGDKSYVLGMDGTAGHYSRGWGQANNIPLEVYDKLNLQNTVNLGIHSKISCWPKQSKLPHLKKILVDNNYRAIVTAWICACSKAEIKK